jgi:hypothetical protein
MDLSAITKKISVGNTKDAVIDGVTYTLKLLSLEQQDIVDHLYEKGKDLDGSSEEKQSLGREMSFRTVAYSLHAIDGEEIPEKIGDKDRDFALQEEVRKWPDNLIRLLFTISLDMKAEYTLGLPGKVQYDWYKSADEDIDMDEEDANAMAEQEEQEGSASTQIG